MNIFNRIAFNLIFFIQVLLAFLLVVEGHIELPPWLQVAGRLHPLFLHLPIGFLIFLSVVFLFQKQLSQESMREIIPIGLLITALSASAAALFGFFLSLQGDYGSDALLRHKISGVTLSWFCYALLLLHHYEVNRKKIFYTAGVLTLSVLIVAGHTGSVLTHGQNFLLAPVSQKKIPTPENSSLFEFAVLPILDRKCFTCHNEAKAKGGLVMTTVAQFKKGGEHGTPWVDGKPSESRMIKAFNLPLDHDEHMPPDGKPQLTSAEIGLIEAWIESGADFEKKLDQFADNDSLKIAVATYTGSSTAETVAARVYDFPAVSSQVVEQLNTPFRSVFPIYLNSPALQADFFLRESFKNKSLEELTVVAQQLVTLNLSKMPVTDKDLELIRSFPNLEVLNLNFTKIDGSGLPALHNLKNLVSLSMAGTSVDATEVESLLTLPRLKEIFLWNTQVDEEEIISLSKAYPAIKIIGDLFKDDKILKLGKPRLDNEGVIRKGDRVALKHSMPGVTIRVAKGGGDVDSVRGELYKEPFLLNESTIIKVKACKEGWYCSDAFTVTCFVEGMPTADVALLTAPDKQYPGKGAAGLTDLQKGFADIFKEPSWMGYREQPFSARFDLGKNIAVRNIVISYGKNIGGFIFPPEEVEIWTGNQIDHLKLIKKMRPEQPGGYGPNSVDALSVSIDTAVPARYYKIVAKPVSKLPTWHNSKGERGWFFVDEIFLY